MKSHARVVVIGGGVVGVSTLYHLAKLGWTDAVLLERSELTAGSTWHAAGLLPLFNMSYTVGQLHKYSVDLYKRLPAETGQDVSFHVTGNLRLATCRDRMDEYRKYCGTANTIGVPFEISFGGRTLFQYAEDVAKTLVLASRSAPDGPRVFNLGGSKVSLDEWVAAIEAAVPGAAGLITVAPTELPFPADIAHDRLTELGDVPVTPYRDAIAATAAIYRRLAADGRLDGAQHGVVAPAPTRP